MQGKESFAAHSWQQQGRAVCRVFVQPYLLLIWPLDLGSLQESGCLEPLFAVPVNRMNFSPSLLWTKKTQSKTQHGKEVFLPLYLIL